MKRVNVNLDIVKSLSNKIFSSGGYLTNEKGVMLGYRSDKSSTTLEIGIARGLYGDNMLHFMAHDLQHDEELRAVISEGYHKQGFYIDFSFVGNNSMYGKVY